MGQSLISGASPKDHPNSWHIWMENDIRKLLIQNGFFGRCLKYKKYNFVCRELPFRWELTDTFQQNKKKKTFWETSTIYFFYIGQIIPKKAQHQRISRHSQGWVRRTRIPFLAAWFCFLLFSRSLPKKCCREVGVVEPREGLCTPGHQAQLVLAVGRVAMPWPIYFIPLVSNWFSFSFCQPSTVAVGKFGRKHNQLRGVLLRGGGGCWGRFRNGIWENDGAIKKQITGKTAQDDDGWDVEYCEWKISKDKKGWKGRPIVGSLEWAVVLKLSKMKINELFF